MITNQVNPNDLKIVEFFNNTDFNFTPELGAMYDGRPLFVGTGEKKQFPYHVGHLLAKNLAKAVMIKGAPLHDSTSNNPIGTPIWSEEGLERIKSSFLTELYADERPIAQTETEKLMARVAELEKNFQDKQRVINAEGVTERPVVRTIEEIVAPKEAINVPKMYQDKAEVIAELEKRGIVHDKRQGKSTLEKLLA